jgi:hypothetical protein
MDTASLGAPDQYWARISINVNVHNWIPQLIGILKSLNEQKWIVNVSTLIDRFPLVLQDIIMRR